MSTPTPLNAAPPLSSKNPIANVGSNPAVNIIVEIPIVNRPPEEGSGPNAPSGGLGLANWLEGAAASAAGGFAVKYGPSAAQKSAGFISQYLPQLIQLARTAATAVLNLLGSLAKNPPPPDATSAATASHPGLTESQTQEVTSMFESARQDGIAAGLPDAFASLVNYVQNGSSAYA